MNFCFFFFSFLNFLSNFTDFPLSTDTKIKGYSVVFRRFELLKPAVLGKWGYQDKFCNSLKNVNFAAQ